MPLAAPERKKRDMLKKLLKREDGVVALEFVILFPLFLLIVVGIVEFGHLWYVRHTLTNATREGARAAVVYMPGSAAARKTSAEQMAKDKVYDYLNPKDADENVRRHLLPRANVTWDAVVLATDGKLAGETGSKITVTASAENVGLVLDALLPDINQITVSAETTMRLE